MKFQKWPKREPLKHFFPVPNEIFILGLSPGEIAVYCYLRGQRTARPSSAIPAMKPSARRWV